MFLFSVHRTDYVNTDVLSAKVLGVDEKYFQNLTNPIVAVFEHKVVSKYKQQAVNPRHVRIAIP